MTIDPSQLILPETRAPLVVEGAGGLLVPLTARHALYRCLRALEGAADPVRPHQRWAPSTTRLLSLEAIRARNIPLLGIAFIGEANDDSERIICRHRRCQTAGPPGSSRRWTGENLAARLRRRISTARISR